LFITVVWWIQIQGCFAGSGSMALFCRILIQNSLPKMKINSNTCIFGSKNVKYLLQRLNTNTCIVMKTLLVCNYLSY
jgi:hypothetical protein